jgi:hypothetical protein
VQSADGMLGDLIGHDGSPWEMYVPVEVLL